ncbi:MAG TPA: hypothetical protein VF763_06955 [Candidatus Limnocylindrales bacterium]
MHRMQIMDELIAVGAGSRGDPTIELEPAILALCGDARTTLEVLSGAVALRVRTYARTEGGAARTIVIAYPADHEAVA